MNVLQMQFLDVSVQVVEKSRCERGAGDEVEEGDGFESEVCDSIPYKVQFSVNCQMIS